MGSPDRSGNKNFENRRSAIALAVETAMRTNTDAGIKAAWTGENLTGTIQPLLHSTKQSVVTGASIALGAVDLTELQMQARVFAETHRSHPETPEDPARQDMIVQYRNELLALSGEPLTGDETSELLGEDPLTPYRRELGVAIAKFALVTSVAETNELDTQRFDGLRGLTVKAIDTVLTDSRPDWIAAPQPPQSGPRQPRDRRPTAGTTALPTQPARRRPSLMNLPGSGLKF